VIAREAATNAASLTELTATYTRTGAGLEADHRRSLTELDRRRKEVEAAVGQLEVASAELVRRIRLDPRAVVAPVEPPETVLRLIADDCPLDDLITTGLRHRPELAEAQALVQATLSRLRQARLRPLIPSLAFRYSGGRLRWRSEQLLRQLRSAERRRRQPVLGGPEPRVRRPSNRQVAGRPATDGLPGDAQGAGPGGGGSRPLRQGAACGRATDAGGGSGLARGPRLVAIEPDQYPPGGRPARLDETDRGPPADPGGWPRRGPITSTPSWPTTVPSSASTAPWGNRRCPPSTPGPPASVVPGNSATLINGR